MYTLDLFENTEQEERNQGKSFVDYRIHPRAAIIGTRATSIYKEISTRRVYLINDDRQQLWIEKSAYYVSQKAKCGRHHEVLNDIASARISACEGCVTAIMEAQRVNWTPSAVTSVANIVLIKANRACTQIRHIFSYFNI